MAALSFSFSFLPALGLAKVHSYFAALPGPDLDILAIADRMAVTIHFRCDVIDIGFAWLERWRGEDTCSRTLPHRLAIDAQTGRFRQMNDECRFIRGVGVEVERLRHRRRHWGIGIATRQRHGGA